MAGRILAWTRSHLSRVLWAIAFLIVVALGIWGFLDLQPAQPGGPAPPPLGFPQAAYSTVRLFTLNLDVPDGAAAPPQLWVAAVAAPFVTARGLAALFKDRFAGVVTQYFTRPRVVVFGANARTAVLVAAEARPTGRRDAIVVVDPDPVALATITAPRIRKVVGDGTSAESLARTAVLRTSTVVVCTGDHVRNSSITTHVLDTHPRPGLDVFVEVDGYGLASVLEQGGRQGGAKPTPFSAPALAVEAVLDELDGVSSLLAAGAHGEPSTIVVFGTGALVDAAMVDLYRRRRLQLLADGAASAAVPRIVLFGPDAPERRDTLLAVLGTELQVLDIDALATPLGQLVELGIGTARRLARHTPRHVLVLVPSDVDGGVAAALARHFGRTTEIVVINESPSTPIGDEIVRQAEGSPLMSPVRIERVPDRAYTLTALRAERRADRLARTLPPDQRSAVARREAARAMIAKVEADGVVVRRDVLADVDPPHLPLLDALGLEPSLAVARARLTVDVQNPDTIARAATRMLTSGSPHAFATWCEVARLRDDPAVLRDDLPAAAAGDPDIGPDVADVRDLLELRCDALEGHHGQAPPGDDTLAHPMTVVLCAGPSDDARVAFLGVTWERPPAGLTVWTTALPGSRLVCAAADEGVTLLPPPCADRTPSRRRAIAIWRAVLAHGDPRAVRVLVLPDASLDEILIARALGATIGRVETATTPDVTRAALGGAAGIVPLPDDRMTVRAFLRKTTWPAEMGDAEPIARELHNSYVRRERERNAEDGPALERWETLLPWLQESNRAVVRDVPNKLAALGLRLAAPGTPGAVDELKGAVDANRELLAEQEHGRFTEERLTSGWTSGVRDPARFMSPHLKPWTALDEDARNADRGVLHDLFGALIGKGIGGVPWTP